MPRCGRYPSVTRPKKRVKRMSLETGSSLTGRAHGFPYPVITGRMANSVRFTVFDRVDPCRLSCLTKGTARLPSDALRVATWRVVLRLLRVEVRHGARWTERDDWARAGVSSKWRDRRRKSPAVAQSDKNMSESSISGRSPLWLGQWWHRKLRWLMLTEHGRRQSCHRGGPIGASLGAHCGDSVR